MVLSRVEYSWQTGAGAGAGAEAVCRPISGPAVNRLPCKPGRRGAAEWRGRGKLQPPRRTGPARDTLFTAPPSASLGTLHYRPAMPPAPPQLPLYVCTVLVSCNVAVQCSPARPDAGIWSRDGQSRRRGRDDTGTGVSYLCPQCRSDGSQGLCITLDVRSVLGQGFSVTHRRRYAMTQKAN